jgi:integrase
MDLETLFNEKNISESSKNLYIKNLTRLNDGGQIKNVNFLKDEKIIEEKLSKYKPNTRRSYIIACVSLLSTLAKQSQKKYQKLYNTYYKIMEEMNNNLKTNNEKSEKEKENWISQDEVMNRLEELKKIIPTLGKKLNEEQFSKLQQLLLLALYSLQKPRRNKDYQFMLIYKKAPHVDDEEKHNSKQNILDLKNNKFIFTNFKTQKTYKKQQININPELRDIIDTYLKYHPTFKKSKEPVSLIVNFKGQPYLNNNDMTRLLYKIFDKKIGSTMLRHIFLTFKYKDALSEMQEDATEMGTSTDMVTTQYVKHD